MIYEFVNWILDQKKVDKKNMSLKETREFVNKANNQSKNQFIFNFMLVSDSVFSVSFICFILFS
jgi:hypothetical protein